MYGSKTVVRCVNKVRNGTPILNVAMDEGVSEKTIRTWCKNAGVRSPQARWTENEKMLAAKMWNEGSSSIQISQSIGRTISSVKAFIRNNRDVAPYRYRKNEQANAR